MENKENIKLNIVPKTSIYSLFERVSYKPEYAIAEFIDNSTDSYYKNIEELKSFYAKRNKKYILKIYIIYDRGDKNNKDAKIIIKDNALGMDLKDFERAILMDMPPEDKSGRSEFGMGLKTAAIWFSNKWTVRSSRLGSDKSYTCQMDVKNLKETNKEAVDIVINQEKNENHGTFLELSELKKSFDNRKINSLIKLITGMYRQDLRSGNIKIFFIEKKGEKYIDYINDEKVVNKLSDCISMKYFEVEPRLLIAGEHSLVTETKVAKFDFQENLVFNNVTYLVTGFIGIRKTGSRSKAGFSIFRRGRVVLGNPPDMYRPEEIFGDASSFVYQRLYGEITVDGFPANQAKDGFAWDDGLNDEFNKLLYKISESYKNIANGIRKNEKSAFGNLNKNDLKQINDFTGNSLKNAIKNNSTDETEITSITESEEIITSDKIQLKHVTEVEYINKVNNVITKYVVGFSEELNPQDWIILHEDILEPKIKKYTVIINIEHKALKPLSENKVFIKFIKFFVTAYATSLISLMVNSSDGKIDAIEFNESLNQFILKGELQDD